MGNFEAQRAATRTTGLLREDLGDDLVVYDTETDTAHLLNATSRRVFEAATGGTQVGLLLALFEDLPEDDRKSMVLLALDQLQRSNLIELSSELPTGLSRRQLLRNLVITAVAAPAVVSILAPTPAAATGTGTACVSSGGTCTTKNSISNCCSGLFCDNNRTCQPQKTLTTTCTGSYECQSGCCSSANPSRCIVGSGAPLCLS